MNRLEAARSLHNSHRIFKNGDGTYMVLIHVTKDASEWDEEWLPGIYYYQSRVEGLSGCSPHFKDWTRLTWQEVRNLLRQAFPKRHPYQCEHLHESGARCTLSKDDHNHCKRCGEAHMFRDLCFTCKTEADAMRVEITRKLATFRNTFNVHFEKDGELYDYLTGAYDDEPHARPRGDHEDFHADG